MILKKTHNNFIVLVVAALILGILSVARQENILIFAHNVYENLLTIDPGFSSARNLVDEGGDAQYQNILTKSLAIASNSNRIVNHIYSKSDSDLEHIQINLKFENYRKILDDREDSIKRGFLHNPQEVKAEIVNKGKSYKASIRLKGDLGDHWLSQSRLSFRVKLKGGKTILGMNSFSIHKPRARQHPYDQTFQSLYRDNGNLSVNYNYALVTVNNEQWGVMHLEEHFSKQFLEKFRQKESLIFRFSDDLFWKNYKKSVDKPYEYYLLSNSSYSSSIYNSNKYLEDNYYRRVYSYILEERLKIDHSHIYDLPSHMQLFFMSLAWNNFHTLSDHNTKYYFNPYTLKLNPISSDQGIFSKYDVDFIEQMKSYKFPLNFKQVFSKFSKSPSKEEDFYNSIQVLENTEERINEFSTIFPLDKVKNMDKLSNNISSMLARKQEIFKSIETYNANNPIKEASSPSDQQAKELLHHFHVRHYDDGLIKIFNLLPDKVKIEEIIVNQKTTEHRGIDVESYIDSSFMPLIIKTQYTGLRDNSIKVISNYKGHRREQIAFPTLLTKGVTNPLTEDVTKQLPFLIEENNNQYKIIKGKWILAEPLVLSGDLFIEPGAELNFSNNSFLIVKGNVNIQGTDNEKVIFNSLDSSWKGAFFLCNTKKRSFINNLVIKGAQSTETGILKLTGGFTILGADIQINNLSIYATKAEDAINIVNSKVDIKNLKIIDAVSDGLDCDFCKGEIKNSSANSINGDAFDFSGSDILMTDIVAREIKDKALSAGEDSKIVLRNSLFSDIGVGLASKDSSVVLAENIFIKNFNLYAAMTYQKKPIFDVNSSMEIIGSQVVGDDPYKRQFGTTLLVDNSLIVESALDIETLYSEGIMKK